LLHVFKNRGVQETNYLSTCGSQGVGIILSPAARRAWESAGSITHDNYGSQILAVRLQVKDSQNRELFVFLVSAYAPIGKADQSDWDNFFTNLSQCQSKKEENDILIIGADTNSSMRCSREQNCLRQFGIDYVNDAGLRFASYLSICNMIAITTCFRKSIYGTWVHPRSKRKHQSIISSQTTPTNIVLMMLDSQPSSSTVIIWQ